jgi:hypothetical protein
METKKCSKCGQVKEIINFSKNNKTKDKLHCSCKECDKEKHHKNRERNILNMRNYKKNNSEKLNEYYLKNKENYKNYRESNKDLIKIYMKDYYISNQSKRKEYNEKNSEIFKEKRKEYNEKNSDLLKKKRKEYYFKNKEKISEYNKNYRKNNIDKELIRVKNYYENNKKDIINKSTIRSLEKRRNYPIERLKHNVRNRVREFLSYKNIKKTSKTFEIVGCTPQELKIYIEQKFVDGMDWDNQGKWHIDHIVPLSSGTNEEEIYKLCYFTNLQPLWAIDNIKKGNKII